MLQPVLLVIIPRLQARIQIREPSVRDDAPRVVGCYRGPAEPLPEDFVACSLALGVVGLGEEGRLELGGG